MEVSVVVRFHNEAAWLPAVLAAVRSQCFPAGEVEVIGVDDRSTDGSREAAAPWLDRLLEIDGYSPGAALNRAVEAARGRTVAVLSAHALPADAGWLAALHEGVDEPHLAGTYGAQLYPVNSRFLDKRDLDLFSTLHPRLETRDSDFWNANSIFPRAVWEAQPFDETTYELEDHHWTKLLLPLGYHVRFQPRAPVYHYGHIDRLDREHLLPSPLPPCERVDAAVAELEDPGADWPRVMRAGLTLSSLTRYTCIGRAVHAIGQTLAGHPDFDVRWRMAQALGKIPCEESVRYLADALDDPSFYARDEAAWSLRRLGALAVPVLLARLDAMPADTALFAALALGGSGVPHAERRAVDVLLAGLASVDRGERRNAAYFAGEVVAAAAGAERMLAPLEALRDETDGELAAVGCWALGAFAEAGHRVDARPLHEATGHPHLQVRFEAVAALGKLALVRGASGAEAGLREALAAADGRVRWAAMQSLRRLAEAGRMEEAGRVEGWEDDDFGVRFERELLASSLRRRVAVAAPAVLAALGTP
jgi:hypothetical protein